MRWLRWNFRCLRGRRCADLRADTPYYAELIVTLEYTCAGFGTEYHWTPKTGITRR